MPARDDRREALRQRVGHWAHRLKVEPRIIRVQYMTRKWGSCSASGIITLAADLVDQDPDFRDFVIAHELLHLRVPNHSKLFKALMNLHVPDWRRHEIHRLRHATRKGAKPPGCGSPTGGAHGSEPG
jgi:predicted metal-dependent hydrolase